uniref:Uncharacterized protein n=1 Tax=Anopheles albimanus TaxID=7167 RepID=A0A182FYM4_ANOAL
MEAEAEQQMLLGDHGDPKSQQTTANDRSTVNKIPLPSFSPSRSVSLSFPVWRYQGAGRASKDSNKLLLSYTSAQSIRLNDGI